MVFKKQIPNFSHGNLGFTLIELVIVIGLIGVLAIGLLATIDPFEQLKKGRDTATRNMVEEFYNAALRYYAIKSSFPWNTTVLTASQLTNISGYVTAIYQFGELKQGFTTASGRDKVLVTSTNCGGGNPCDDITVCFRPDSKSFRGDNNTIWNNQGVSIVPQGDPTSTSTYWCIK